MKLTEEEVKRRLIELRNLKVLYARARERIALLEAETKQQKERIKELEAKDKDKGEKIEAMAFQLEQIKNKLFGKKPVVQRVLLKKEKRNRDAVSYQRPIPREVTETRLHPVSECAHCHEALNRKSVRSFFEEDIPLPMNS